VAVERETGQMVSPMMKMSHMSNTFSATLPSGESWTAI
jgi:hypothetical protein